MGDMAKSDLKIFIYALKDPRNNVVRYIGWSSDLKKRLKNHISESKRGKKNHRCNWIRELLKNNFTPIMEIVEETIYLKREEREKYWISYYGRKNLVNGTDGGEGSVGFKHSKETIEKLKTFHSKRKPETNKKISITRKLLKIIPYNKGKKKSDDERLEMSISRKGKQCGNNNPFYGKRHNLITKEKMSLIAKESKRGEKTQGKIRKNNLTSKYCGVRKFGNKWTARIQKNKIRYFLGLFNSETEAAKEYDKEAVKLYGIEAKLNFPLDK